jgi:hypothetical protein
VLYRSDVEASSLSMVVWTYSTLANACITWAPMVPGNLRAPVCDGSGDERMSRLQTAWADPGPNDPRCHFERVLCPDAGFQDT